MRQPARLRPVRQSVDPGGIALRSERDPRVHQRTTAADGQLPPQRVQHLELPGVVSEQVQSRVRQLQTPRLGVVHRGRQRCPNRRSTQGDGPLLGRQSGSHRLCSSARLRALHTYQSGPPHRVVGPDCGHERLHVPIAMAGSVGSPTIAAGHGGRPAMRAASDVHPARCFNDEWRPTTRRSAPTGASRSTCSLEPPTRYVVISTSRLASATEVGQVVE